MPHGLRHTTVTLRLDVCLMNFTATPLLEVRGVSHGFHYTAAT
jgi:hypothetical protein